jgi:hypothetical protein
MNPDDSAKVMGHRSFIMVLPAARSDLVVPGGRSAACQCVAGKAQERRDEDGDDRKS